jgi:hypothetical protein
MTQEHKDILLKDICARLPYGVKAEKYTIRMDGEFVPIANIEIVTAKDILARNECPGYTIKPYLFPLSSMTEDQIKELSKLGVSYGEYALHDDIRGLGIMVEDAYIFFEFCYKHHIDFLGLIEMDIAIDATGKNIY